MKYFSKLHAKEFSGANLFSALTMILTGFLDIVLFPFGYGCDIHVMFCEYRLRKSVERRKKNRN